MSVTAGDVVGSWKIGELAGRGQSGSVFEVTETVPPFRRGALKIHLGPRIMVTRAEFLREAAFVKAQKIRGYMPDFLDDGELDDGTPFFVTEFAEKPSRRLTRDEVVAIVERIAEALERLDAAKFYHGDVKPNNIGMIGGKAVLLDFGSVCSHRDAASASIRLGTPYYTAPELQHGGAVSVLTDLFSLGRTLEELCGENDRRVFDPVAHHAAAFDPKARPQTIAAFRRELANALPSYRRDAAAETRLEKVKTVAKRVGLAVTIVVVVYGIIISASYHYRRTKLRERKAALIETTAVQRAF